MKYKWIIGLLAIAVIFITAMSTHASESCQEIVPVATQTCVEQSNDSDLGEAEECEVFASSSTRLRLSQSRSSESFQRIRITSANYPSFYENPFLKRTDSDNFVHSDAKSTISNYSLHLFSRLNI